MKTTITLTRLFKKEVVIEIDNNLLKGMNEEEIADFVMFDYSISEDVFENASIEHISHLEDVDTDRFDITDDDGNPLYGGHL